MSNIKKVTSFTHHVTGEGSRISATYSELSESGEIIRSNVRFNTVVLDTDTEMTEHIKAINDFVSAKIPE